MNATTLFLTILCGAIVLAGACACQTRRPEATATADTPSKVQGGITLQHNRGYSGVRWLAASKLLSAREREELADITPGISAWNSTSSWNPTTLRWEEDFYGSPGKVGHLGARAILPMSEARAAYRERAFAGMKRTTLAQLRTTSGFVTLYPGASIDKRYGGENAVWDVYCELIGGASEELFRTGVGGVRDSGDSFTSRSITSVPSAGLRSNSGGSSSGYTVYLVPHDMSEPITKKDPALRPYAEYREQRALDLAKRGTPPHASLTSPQDGYVRIADSELQIFADGSWKRIGTWKTKPEGLPSDGRPDPYSCLLYWPPKPSNGGDLWCLDPEGYWKRGNGLFGLVRTSSNLMEIGPLLESWQKDDIHALMNNSGPYSASYVGVPIVSVTPWPQAVYDEDTVVGSAGTEAELRAYYGWEKR